MRTLSLILLVNLVVLTPVSPVMAEEKEEAFVLAYRLASAQTKEFDDPDKADAFAKALTRLGCKSKSEDHEGHIDVTFQQPRWTLVTLQSEELVHKWQDWLDKVGCETLHSEDPEHEDEHDKAHQHEHEEGVEVIMFQSKDWVEKHFEKPGTSAEFLVVCKALGCEFKEDAHDGHADVSFRCVQPRAIECASHEAAEKRAEWLSKLGFAVKHDH